MPRILYVGTDEPLADMMEKLLRRNGYEVQCAMGRNEALAVLRTSTPDAVIIDREDGIREIAEFCNQLRQTSGKHKLLLISENEEDEIPAFDAGADEWMKKPYKMNVLYARLHALLR